MPGSTLKSSNPTTPAHAGVYRSGGLATAAISKELSAPRSPRRKGRWLQRIQCLPDFKADTATYGKVHSLVYARYHNKYDAVISYSRSTYRYKHGYYVLGYKNGQWDLFIWRVFFKDAWAHNIVERTVKLRTRHHVATDSLLANWKQNDFLNLNEDSVNCHSYIRDGKTYDVDISDGGADVFEVFESDKYRNISCVNADIYQKEVPVVQREKFIVCRESFFKFLKGVYGK